MTHSEHAPLGSMARFFYEMREGSRRQGNVVFALIFKELKSRSGTEGYGLISLVGVVLEPALTVLALAAFWYLLRRTEVAGINVALFMAVSYIPFAMVRRSISSVPRTVRSSRSFYAFQRVKPFDTILARFLLELALIMIGGALLLFILGWFFDLFVRTDRMLQGLLIFMAIIVTSFGQSLFVGVYGTKYPVIFKAISLCARGLVIFSAVMHTVSDLPPETQAIIAWNPFAHFEELIRYYMLNLTPFQAVSLNYALSYTVIINFLGFSSYWVNRLKVVER